MRRVRLRGRCPCGLRALAPALIAAASTLAGCASLDMFLFDGQPAEGYDLSGSSIPAALIEPEIFLETEDGGLVHAIWAGQPLPAPTVLYCHGNADNIGRYWDRVELFHELGANVLIFDYRGYGRSEGETTEEHTRADARAAREHLRERGIPDEEVFYYGWSLGAAVCLRLAVEDPPPALVLEAPFASVAHIAESGSGLDLGRGWLAEAVYDNVAAAELLDSPVLVVHGRADAFIPIDHGQHVYHAAPEPKDAYWVDGAGHSDIPWVAGEEYEARVSELLAGEYFHASAP